MPTLDQSFKEEIFAITLHAIENNQFEGVEELIKLKFQHVLGDKSQADQKLMIDDFIKFVRNKVAEIKIKGMPIPRHLILSTLALGKAKGIPKFVLNLAWATFGGVFNSAPNPSTFLTELDIKPVVKPKIRVNRDSSGSVSTTSQSLPSTPKSSAASEAQPGFLRRIWDFIVGLLSSIYNKIRSLFVPEEPRWKEDAPTQHSVAESSAEVEEVNEAAPVMQQTPAVKKSIGSKVVGNVKRLFTPSRWRSQPKPTTAANAEPSNLPVPKNLI